MSTRISRTATALAGVVLLAACGAKAQSQAASVQTTIAVTVSSEAAAGATTTVSDQGGQRRQQLQAWRDCLSQHGVTLPSIAPGQNGQGGASPPTQPATGQPPASDAAGAGGPPPSDNGAGQPPGGRGGFGGGAFTSILADPANKTAVDACASLQPQGGPGGGAGAPGQRGQAFQAYLSCLKDNGVDVPTTVAGGPPASIDRTTPAYAAANTKCEVLLPQRQGGTDTSTTTTVAG